MSPVKYRIIQTTNQKFHLNILYERGVEMEKHEKKLHIMIFCVSCVLVIFMLQNLWTFCKNYEICKAKSEGKILVGSHRDYEGEYYYAVIDQLHLLGLKNISTVDLDHFCILPFNKGKVEDIFINGENNFDDNYYVYPDAKVIIRYK